MGFEMCKTFCNPGVWGSKCVKYSSIMRSGFEMCETLGKNKEDMFSTTFLLARSHPLWRFGMCETFVNYGVWGSERVKH